jgi:hypothetical protein
MFANTRSGILYGMGSEPSQQTHISAAIVRLIIDSIVAQQMDVRHSHLLSLEAIF